MDVKNEVRSILKGSVELNELMKFQIWTAYSLYRHRKVKYKTNMLTTMR